MSGSKALGGGAGSGARRRRTRCRRCQACMRTECGECHFCKDMKKFGGPGRMKQSCLQRQCTAPVLPHTAVCFACGEAGKEDTVDSEEEKFSLCLMECTICNEIIHPSCLKMGKADGIINDEIPNCWECPKCHKEGKTSKDQQDGSGKRRLDNGEVGRWKLTDEPPPKKKAPPPLEEAARGEGGHKRKKEKEQPLESGPKKKIKGAHEKRLKKLSSNLIPPSALHDGFTKQRSNGQETRNGRTRGGTGGGEKENASGILTNHRHAAGGGAKGSRGNKIRNSKNQNQRTSVSSSSSSIPTSNGGGMASSGLLMSAMAASPCQPSRLAPRSQMMKRSPPAVPSPPRPVQMERHLVRPPPACPEPSCLLLDCGSAHIMTRDAWLRVFTYLSQRELCVCMRVCRTWSRWCCDKRLWTQMDLSRQRSITPPMLSGIIRRQPVSLNLGHTNISKKQLMWLINRLPGLLELDVSGCPWTSVSALCQAVCPCLKLLDLSRVEDLKDSHLRELLAPPPESRTAHSESRAGRFQNMTELRLAGLDLTDAASRLLVRHTPHLTRLDLSHCVNITDQTVRNLTVSPLRESLTHINLAGCVKLTEQSVQLLQCCSALQTVDLRSCSLLSAESGQLLSFPFHSASSSSSSNTASSSSSAPTAVAALSSSAAPDDRTLLKNS
ncbi:PREDICTED: F-box/LRR-repeat protein 19 [Cyprinodon variegatus]|uniref:F-box/LRR-repeat protein 19 n=1 Tax=Cyprinodon variegatus TaxID=28743 RepID=UPI0007424FB3|nr:PREDICTED: F-box/LRR-repeat protein 19 [Cyprinodon variegatus]